MSKNQKAINLALQGGGAHGAYAWGIVDHLLEDGRLKLNAITACSAGAMNAAVIAYGFHLDGPAGAKAKLEEFWREISKVRESFGVFDNQFLDNIPYYTEIENMISQYMLDTVTTAASPYQFNPLGLNPLRDILLKVIDFEALNSCKWIDLFISATNVKTGKVKVFAKEDLTPDHLLASACLPNLFQAVEIDDQFYWDGGYMGNPSLWPLFYETEVTDLLVVHINPIERPEIPRTPSEISNRVNEITFNSALLKEMRAVSFVQKLVSEGWLKDEYKDKLSNIIFHSIRAEKVFQNLSLASKYDTGWEFLTKLKSYGQEEAKLWLESNYDHVGKKSSVHLHEEFLDR